MLLNDMKEELRRFAEHYCLDVTFKEDRDMRHSDIYPIIVCERITYIYTFTNPRTGYGRKFAINHSEAVNNGKEIVRDIKDNLLSDPRLIDRMKKPQWIGTALGIEAEQKITGSGGSPYLTNLYPIDTETNVSINLDCNVFADYIRKSMPEPFKVPEHILTNDETEKQWKYFSDKWAKAREELMKPRIEKVIFNKPYTIVLWSDKTKTMVKATDEAYDEEKGLAMAICKEFLGTNESKGNYFDEFKKWLPKEEPITLPVLTVYDICVLTGLSKEEVIKNCKKGMYPGAKKDDRVIDGWAIPFELKDELQGRLLTAAELAEKTGQSVSTVRKDCARGLHPGAKKVDGKWLIPYEGMVKKGE